MAWISENYGFPDESDVIFQKVSINQLSSDLSQVVIYGVIIAKQSARRIASKKMPGAERFVLNFTIRDSPTDTINAACWGEDSSICTLSKSFTIGDVVKIKNPQITDRQRDAADEKFRPAVNSQYQLNISPIYSEITVCIDEERREYEKLLHCAMHPTDNMPSLADIVYNSQNAEGLTMNLLVAIREIGALQTMKTKDGREVKKLMLSVFDQTHPAFSILIWEEETANFILKYCCKRSVLLISDIKVNYNTYMKEMAATAGSTTIFTPEPDIADKRVLYQYAMKVILQSDNPHNTKKFNDSNHVYTVNEILKLMTSSDMMVDEIQGTLHAFLSAFDIDGSNKITSLRCPGCLQLLQKAEDKCINGSCEVGSGMKNLPPEELYDFVVSLADRTGSLTRCLLTGQVAQNFLGLSVQDFSALSADDKTALKWKCLFEKFNLQFKVSPSSSGNDRPIFRLLNIEVKDT